MGMGITRSRLVRWVCSPLVAVAMPAFGQPVPDYDFQWSTVGAAGNAPYTGTLGTLQGRGSVAHEFRASRLEVTTSQWLEFFNTFSTQGLSLPFVNRPPVFWGATRDFDYSGPGVRYRLVDSVNAGMFPVGGMSWRDSAMFCNWLHNDKSSALSAIQNGAYDTSTFGRNPDRSFTDQLTRSAGARFWIPSIDEAIKAAHFDPNRFGDGQAGYWERKNRSDGPTPSGPPGVGQTSAGWLDPVNPFGEMRIPLGSYPSAMSPWGLWDTSGGVSELTEHFSPDVRPSERGYFGSTGGDLNYEYTDGISVATYSRPDFGPSRTGLRIASSVPSPGVACVLVAFVSSIGNRRRRPCSQR